MNENPSQLSDSKSIDTQRRTKIRALFSSRHVDAFVKTIFFFAIMHLVILTGIAIRGNIHVLNAFSILNLDFFLPNLGSGMVNFIFSYTMVLALYFLVFLTLTKPSKPDN